MTEPASVVASRLPSRRIRAAVLAAAALTTAGCANGLGQACPAIGYSSTLVVQLDDGWPAGAGRQAELSCPGCGLPVDGTPGSVQVLPIGTEVGFALTGALPGQVTVRVLEGDEVVAEVTVEPEFVRVDGTEECGGNTRAEVVVPAP